MRTLWLGNGNVDINRHYPAGNFNCSFTNIRKWEDFGDVFYLLMVGSGVGFKSTKKMARNMKPIRNNTELILEDYEELAPEERNESKESIVEISEDNKRAKITITDSKEAWVSSLMEYFKLLTNSEYDSIETITINFDNIRPKGERLKTFGGFASGYEPMRGMFKGVDEALKNTLDQGLAPLEESSKGEGYVKLRPIHVLDIGNLIANNVVAGGVRRSAEIFLFDSDDYESMLAKYGINGLWTEEQLQQHLEVGKVLEEKGVKPKWFDELTEYTEWKFKKLPKQYGLEAKRDELAGKIKEMSIKGLEDVNTLKELSKLKEVEGLEDIKAVQELKSVLEDLEELTREIQDKNPRKNLGHRNMSNNSVAFTEKPKRKDLNLIFQLMQLDGEPKKSWAL